MRTREEIKRAERDPHINDVVDDHLILEVLLDIRDLLNGGSVKPPRTYCPDGEHVWQKNRDDMASLDSHFCTKCGYEGHPGE